MRVGGGLLVVVLMVGLVVPTDVAAYSGGSGETGFSDVGGGVHAPAVGVLAAEGVFEGTECGQGLFCPNDPLDRWVMAVWLVRVLDDVDPVGSGSRFSDVEATEWWAPFVDRLAALGVTRGCATGPARYCPHDSVTRAQMATFLTRAFGLEAAPPFGFVDVESNTTHSEDIDALAGAGITVGCDTNPARFCPGDSVTRAEMATFLARAIEHDSRSQEPPDDGDELADVVGGSVYDSGVRPVVGDWVVPVYVCAPPGRYTEKDLKDLTTELNQELDGFFEGLSSQKMTLRFTEGSVSSGGIAWEDTAPSDLLALGAFPCGEEAQSQSGTTQVLIFLDVPGVDRFGRENVAAYARLATGPAIAPPPAKAAAITSYLRTVVHELAHSVLGLHHLKHKQKGSVFVNELVTSEFLSAPALACYQYEQLDWPVPDYVEPCVRLSPSRPEAVTYELDNAGRDTVTWDLPRFTDDAPITGYTVKYYQGTSFSSNDEPYLEHQEPADARVHVIDQSIDPGTYLVAVAALTKYGEGDPSAASLSYVPRPPPLAPIRATNITQDSIQLVWNPRTQIEFLEETDIRVTYQIQYKATGDTRGYQEILTLFEGTVWLGHLEQGTEYTIRMRACSDISIERCTGWQTIRASTFTDSVLPPPGPISTSSGSDWYLLTWDPVPGAAGYLIELPGGRQIRTYAPDYSGAFGLQPNTTYSLKVGTCSPGSLNCEPEEWTTVTVATTSVQAVPPPYRIGLREIAGDWASVQWEALRDGRWLHRVEYEYTDGTTSSGVLTHQKHTEEPLRLTVEPNKTYSLKMRHCEYRGSGNSCSVWTSFGFSTGPATSPVTPPSVRATDKADIWLGFSWDRVPGAVSYDWRFKEANAGSPWTWGNETEPTLGTRWRLEPNTTYTAEVRSCGDPTRPCSNWTTTTVSTTRPLAPAPQSYPVSVTSVTATQIHLAWNPPSAHGHYYTAKLFPSEGEHLIFVHILQALSQDWVISNLEPNTAYTLAVRVCQWPLDSNCDDWVAMNVTTRPS